MIESYYGLQNQSKNYYPQTQYCQKTQRCWRTHKKISRYTQTSTIARDMLLNALVFGYSLPKLVSYKYFLGK